MLSSAAYQFMHIMSICFSVMFIVMNFLSVCRSIRFIMTYVPLARGRKTKTIGYHKISLIFMEDCNEIT